MFSAVAVLVVVFFVLAVLSVDEQVTASAFLVVGARSAAVASGLAYGVHP